METPASPPPLVIWTSRELAPAVGTALATLSGSVRPVALGGPTRSAVADLADELELSAEDDLRHMIDRHPGAALLVAARDGVDVDLVGRVLTGSGDVVMLEPIDRPLAPARPGRRGGPGGPGRLLVLPATRSDRGWRMLMEHLETTGAPEAIGIRDTGGPTGGSLLRRLYDAWDAVLGLVEMPESVSATLGGPLRDPPTEPGGLSGHLSVHGRGEQASAVTMLLSDRTGRESHSVRMIAPHGELLLDASGGRVLGTGGELLDDATPAPADLGQRLAGQWPRALDSRDAALSDDAHARRIACCRACLLSTRTSQPESPARLLEIQGG